MTDTLYLIDGSGYIFRAYYAVRPLSTSTGIPTNAVFGFAKMLLKLLKDKQPDHVAIAFDRPEPTFRHEMFEDYKANRDEAPEDLIPQIQLIHELVEAMEIPLLVQPGYEADDLMASMARHWLSKKARDVVLVTGDKDLMQLVGDRMTMFDPMKDRIYDREGVIEKFGVGPEHVADALGLAGDSSDNIPGVPKVGIKSAAKLINEFGNVEKIIDGLATREKPKAFERSVLENQEDARLSKRLAVLHEEAPLSLDESQLTYQPPSEEKLGAFLAKIEAKGLMRELGWKRAASKEKTAAPAPTPSSEAPLPDPELTPIDRSQYKTINTHEALDALIEEIREQGTLSIDLETTSLDAMRADIVGFAIALEQGGACYIPVAHRALEAVTQLKRAEVIEKLKPLLEDSSIKKIGQNLKYDINVFHRAGIRLQGIAGDSMLAAYVLDPSRPSYSLDNLAREFLGHDTISYTEIAGKGKDQRAFDEIPVVVASEYAAEDADVAMRLRQILEPRVRQADQSALYHELELPLVNVLASLERRGIMIDTDHLQSLSKEMNGRLRELESKAYELAGRTLNLNSTKQLGALFFDELKYPVIKKTKTGYSTDQEVLETLAADYELPQVVLECRSLNKLLSTYVDALPRMLNPETGRVHTNYNQTGTATGRLSSSDPNLQNIPIRTDDGKRIRAAFVTEPGWTLIAADYSQIELRLLAHLSEDELFLQAFRDGEDVHRRTAQEILTGGREPTSDERRSAKAINFGIIYGLSEFGLSKQLGISRQEAHTYIAAYFARYPGIRTFLDGTIDEGRERGFVATLAGRKRFLPNLGSKNTNVRRGAERIAMNTPIQGSAADLLKMAMLKIHDRLERDFQGRILLQVHDELVLEAPDDECEQVASVVREEMEQVMALKVPLVVDVGMGANWAIAH